ncbi:MAG TPA: MmgE/PrpD family protein, partial [Gaiellaceae bacterium]|nr:MmgE/PrpD family protein [Gaiellaceae bacterium]
MSATARLAERALAAAGAEPPGYLRSLTLCNVAAAAGHKGGTERLLGALRDELGSGPGAEAFLAAAALHCRTQDDFYPEGRVHVGAITLAATLALADEAGDRLLECLAAGYEVMCAVSAAYAPAAQAAGLRPSGVFGPLGAAASASV